MTQKKNIWFSIKDFFRSNKDPLTAADKLVIIEQSSKQVGFGVFFSTIIVITSFLPVLKFCLNWRKTIIAVNLVARTIGVFMMTKLGSEFMPPLDEGSVLFMPIILPDVSNSEVKRLLQVQEALFYLM